MSKAFGRAHNVAASLIVYLIMSIVIILYFQPQVNISIWIDIGIVFVIDIFAFALAYTTSKKNWGRGILRMIVFSLGWAFLLTVALDPKNNQGLIDNFFVVLGIQIVGSIIGFILL